MQSSLPDVRRQDPGQRRQAQWWRYARPIVARPFRFAGVRKSEAFVHADRDSTEAYDHGHDASTRTSNDRWCLIASRKLTDSMLCYWSCCLLRQFGRTTFDVQAILQKRDILPATSDKTMYETTDSQYLKLKTEDKRVLYWNYYTIVNNNLLQISICGMPVIEVSLTLSFLCQYQC